MRLASAANVLTAWLIAVSGGGALALAFPAAAVAAPARASSGCHTAQASIAFDFEGASRSACQVDGERAFSILITPEHAPPINPSPWYAFRYTAKPGPPVTVTLRYHGARHRYAPKWQGDGDPAAVQVTEAEDGSAVSLTLPAGKGTVSGQPLLTARDTDRLIARIAKRGGGQRLVLGRSHDGRAIEAVRLGNREAPQLVVLLGRQHPPEVTGAMAMDAFAQEVAEQFASGAIDRRAFQFLVVPLLNPDGVARGHWRANLGGVDINRDWGTFRQPETRAVATWLDQLPTGVAPALMLDFHSTGRNLFYVQGDDASAQSARFRANWLDGQEAALAGYPFTIEPRDANPGAGTTKNWFHARYGIPAFTYEVGDQTDPAAIRGAARALARTMIPALIRAQAKD